MFQIYTCHLRSFFNYIKNILSETYADIERTHENILPSKKFCNYHSFFSSKHCWYKIAWFPRAFLNDSSKDLNFLKYNTFLEFTLENFRNINFIFGVLQNQSWDHETMFSIMASFVICSQILEKRFKLWTRKLYVMDLLDLPSLSVPVEPLFFFCHFFHWEELC